MKYGFPHKLYLHAQVAPYTEIKSSRSFMKDGVRVQELDARETYQTEHYKFYSEHLKDATDEQLERFNTASRSHGLRPQFHHSPEGLAWKIPAQNHD
jgi:hypothetical protein